MQGYFMGILGFALIAIATTPGVPGSSEQTLEALYEGPTTAVESLETIPVREETESTKARSCQESCADDGLGPEECDLECNWVT